jgi:hypothetical protein
VAWNSPLKKFLRKEWLTNLYNQFKAPRQPDEAFKLNPPKRPLLVSWALRAWESVSTRTIAAGFKGVGIETNLFPPKTLPGPLEKVDAELEELSNSVFDELAKLELIDKEFTISSEDSDAFNEEEGKSEIIIDLDLDGEEKKEINEYDDEEDDEEQGDSSDEDCGEEVEDEDDDEEEEADSLRISCDENDLNLVPEEDADEIDADEYDLAMHDLVVDGLRVDDLEFELHKEVNSEIADFDFLNTKDEDLDDPDGWNFNLC